jgi:3-deoxy-D-manno-octulosonate 8-phosphate phosphatase (KDO 8-P phosphatase)
MDLIAIAKKIKLLILDCDGILTNGKIYITNEGAETIAFNVLDGYGVLRLKKSGVEIAVISGRKNNSVEYRLSQLNIEHIFLGHLDKVTCFNKLIDTLKVSPEYIAYMGDDLPDIDIMKKVALPITVPNAIDAVKKIAIMCTQKKGGNGAVREVCDFIYDAQNT